eukprot:7544259-Lingulodinium_polyedra.AAC.1
MERIHAEVGVVVKPGLAGSMLGKGRYDGKEEVKVGKTIKCLEDCEWPVEIGVIDQPRRVGSRLGKEERDRKEEAKVVKAL